MFIARDGFWHVQEVRPNRGHAKRGPTCQKMSDSSATFSGLSGPLLSSLWRVASFESALGTLTTFSGLGLRSVYAKSKLHDVTWPTPLTDSIIVLYH